MIKEITRFAPSPTGDLHLGGLRTLLFNYLLARQSGGKLLLRIEDTDRRRSCEEASARMRVLFDTFQIPFDGDVYVQSKRLPIYEGYARRLIEKKAAYICKCSSERLASLSQGYDHHCRDKEEGRDDDDSFPSPRTALVRDRESGTILLKSDRYPTYHLASIVDDHESSITSVLRGNEWLPSLPLHLSLWKAFGWAPPRYYHLPLLLDGDGMKLSKRSPIDRGGGNWTAQSLLDRGYLPSAILNYVLFLGWSPKGRVEAGNSLDELAFDHLNIKSNMFGKFRIEHVGSSDSKVDLQKLNWINTKHLQAHSNKPIVIDQVKRILIEENNVHPALCASERINKAIQLLQDRIVLPNQIARFLYLFKAPATTSTAHNEGGTASRLTESLKKHLISGAFDPHTFKAIANEHGMGVGKVIRVFRQLITGCDSGPPLMDIIDFIGIEECLRRVEHRAQKTL